MTTRRERRRTPSWNRAHCQQSPLNWIWRSVRFLRAPKPAIGNRVPRPLCMVCWTPLVFTLVPGKAKKAPGPAAEPNAA